MKIQPRLNEFLNVLTKFVNDQIPLTMKIGKWEQPVPRREFSIEKGSKYVRIVKNDVGDSHRTVYCFVDINTGDILKAASWKAPAPRGVRGNIFADDFGMSCCDRHGVKYLVGPRK